MRARILDFVQTLRARGGVDVSVSESLDALVAVAAVGVEREAMREALAAALVKHEADRPAFDRLFDEAFPLVGVTRRGAGAARAAPAAVRCRRAPDAGPGTAGGRGSATSGRSAASGRRTATDARHPRAPWCGTPERSQAARAAPRAPAGSSRSRSASSPRAMSRRHASWSASW